ncbi:hypothetical protein MY3957_000747 [Beauveria namnaoensis]
MDMTTCVSALLCTGYDHWLQRDFEVVDDHGRSMVGRRRRETEEAVLADAGKATRLEVLIEG